ncbi:MAG: two-component system response regulator [Desulfuromonas sp.]|nr:MAG: two-component system response regulator [Desulfuromonas sp.]
MSSRKTVLLADDVNLFLELEKTFLRRTDIDIVTAANGKIALEQAKKHKPALAFIDLNMPEMNGDACCRAIKQDEELRHMVVYIVTTVSNIEDLARCEQAGCDGIINKPINRTEFLQVAHSNLAIEIRREPRHYAQVRVSYGTEPQNLLTGYSINMSSGGLFIETGTLLAEDEHLTLVFRLPERDKPIICQGRVAWTNPPDKKKKKTLPPGVGVQFFDLRLDDMQSIRTYLNENDLKPSW